jgi:MoaA/NifB/PqqE/SkfB family radical SAM enzyme
MMTEESHSQGVANREDKVRSHEDAAHEKRNWVRLTFACNDHCIFCLDSNTHDGSMRSREEVRAQIVDGRRKGATRLILSGGEPTIHPQYVDFIKLGRQAGYEKIQTVTNGRLFSYGDFLSRCLDAGLDEITFSIHGHNAKVHDALVGTKGAFDEELKGLKGALADGRPIVNVDIVVNRGNVKHLPDMLKFFTELGVGEFDLLQVVPFGRAFDEGRDTLFYDLFEMRPYLQAALAYSKRPDVHLWMNRFPPQHLEGYEHLIQDPYKLNDEVRGRKEEYERLLTHGEWLDCRDPARCKYCYLERLCDTLEGVMTTVDTRAFDVVRVDTEWESMQPAVFGGDPASRQRAEDKERARVELSETKRSLPIVGTPTAAPGRPVVLLEALIEEASPTTLLVVAPDMARASGALARFPSLTNVELHLGEYAGLAEALAQGGALAGRTLVRTTTDRVEAAQSLLALEATFDVEVLLTQETAKWLLSQELPSPRLSLRQPTYERLTEAAERDVDLHAFFHDFRHPLATVDIPACVSGRAPQPRRKTLDTAMMTVDGKLEIFRYARRYIMDGYSTKSLRCTDCRENAACDGMHINQIRAHGYAVMRPIAAVP